MSNGFADASLNNLIAVGILEHIIMKVIECVDMMRNDCESLSQRIKNHEPTIRDYLFDNYLNNDDVMNAIGCDNYRFHSEVPENYINTVTPVSKTSPAGDWPLIAATAAFTPS